MMRLANPASKYLSPGSLTDIPGVEVGHFTDPRRPTGCTVVLTRHGAVCGVDVRGAAPGTRETDLLEPGNLVQQVHGIVLSGGSAWGLDTASGAMRWLEEHGHGIETGFGLVPIIPAAVVFDLSVGDGRIRPDAAAGYQACVDANTKPVLQGNVGAGTGATVGKLFGAGSAMKGGIGSASISTRGQTVAALVVCNAVGDVFSADSGEVLAGAIGKDGTTWLDTHHALVRGIPTKSILPGTNTTIGVIATNARIDKSQAKRLAMAGHDGLARSIRPVHTMLDGDTLFAIGTGEQDTKPDMLLLCTLAAEVTARAVINAVLTAETLQVGEEQLRCAREVMSSRARTPLAHHPAR